MFEKLPFSESLAHVAAVAVAFAVITFLHVVVGELAPKTVAIQKTETVALAFARPLILFYRIAFPFIWALNSSARFVTGLFGIKPASEHELAHSEEELRIILSESYESGEINQSEYKYVNRIFEFDDRIAKEIMVPRTEIAVLKADEPFQESLEMMSNEKYTRYPVVNGDKDNIAGMVNSKEVFTDLFSKSAAGQKDTSLTEYIRPVIQVIETTPIRDLLIKMQKERVHLAVLVDEYGGTAGLVTVEDIIEEIVGEIRDEFDQDEIPEIQRKSEHHFIFNGKVLLHQLNSLLYLQIEEEDIDTVGGWMLSQNMDIGEGDTLFYEDYEFTVRKMDGHLIRSVEVLKIHSKLKKAEAENS